MRTLSGKEVCQILGKYGFEQVRQKGSHIIMQMKTEEVQLLFPYLTIKS